MDYKVPGFVVIFCASIAVASGFIYPEPQPEEDFPGLSREYSFPGPYLPRDPFDTPYRRTRPFRWPYGQYPWFFPRPYPRPRPWHPSGPSRDCDDVFCPVGTTCGESSGYCFGAPCRRQRRCMPNYGTYFTEPRGNRGDTEPRGTRADREQPSYIS